jgi:excisionase family DNA binding protein
VQDELDQASVPRSTPALAEPLLTAGDVAELLRVPRSSVYEYARRRHRPLPSVAIGRHRRFVRSDLDAWLLEQRG